MGCGGKWCQARPVGFRPAGKSARREERAGGESAPARREDDGVPAFGIKIGMRRQKSPRFGGRCAAEAADIVMAVALDVPGAEESGKRRILLHRQSGLAGEVLAGDEITC